ncbi:HIT domain-containing protein [bacterium]|nr:HIT domain-containing protein [bacterium]
MESPFLEKTKLIENEHGFVIYDGFPVSKGHCLVVPHRVYSNYKCFYEFDGLFHFNKIPSV